MSYTAADRTLLTRIDANVAGLAGPFQQQITDLTAQVSTLTDQLAASKAAEQSDQSAIDTLQGQLTAAEQQVADLQAQLATVEDELAACEAEHDPPAARFAGDPGTGTLYYGESRDGGDPTAREAYYGHNVGAYRSYFLASDSAATVAGRATRDLAAKRVPIISTKLPGTWADVAAGRYDSWLNALLTALGKVAGPVWFCMHHEPWDDQGTGQTPADYVAMYRHAWSMKPANVAFVPILQSAPFDATVYGKQDITPWYDPACCDAVGIDTYNHWYPGGTNKWRDPATVAQFFDVLKAKFGKPIVVAEYGVRSDPANPGKAAQWMRDFRDLCVSRGDIAALSFFDSSLNVNDGGTPWSLDYGDNERLDAFKSLLTASAFL